MTSAEGGISLARVMGITTSTNVSVGAMVWVVCGVFEFTAGDRDALGVCVEPVDGGLPSVVEDSEAPDVVVMKVVGIAVVRAVVAVVFEFWNLVMADPRAMGDVGAEAELSKVPMGIAVFADVGVGGLVGIVEFWPTLNGGVGSGTTVGNVAVLFPGFIVSEGVIVVKPVAGEAVAVVVALATIGVLAVIVVLLVAAVRTGAIDTGILGDSSLPDGTGSGPELLVGAAGLFLMLGEIVCGIIEGLTVVEVDLGFGDVVEVLDSMRMPVTSAPSVVIVVPSSVRTPVDSAPGVIAVVPDVAAVSVTLGSEMVVEAPDSVEIPVTSGPGLVEIWDSVRMPVASVVVVVPDSVGMTVASAPGDEVGITDSVRMSVTGVVTRVSDAVEMLVALGLEVGIKNPDSVGISDPGVVIVVPGGAEIFVPSGSRVEIPDPAGMSVGSGVVVRVSATAGMSVASDSGTVVEVLGTAGVPVISGPGTITISPDSVGISVVAGSGTAVEIPDSAGMSVGSAVGVMTAMTGIVKSGVATDAAISVITAATEVGSVAAMAVGIIIPPSCS